MQGLDAIAAKQRQYFLTHATQPYEFRIKTLRQLRRLIVDHENDITAAIHRDLHKSSFEALFMDVWIVLKELDYIMKNLQHWMHVKKMTSPFPLSWPGKSHVYYQPYGTTLIMSPWNFPFQLCFSPLIGAIAAGNCVVLKPSELAPHTQAVMIQLINDHFPSEYIYAANGAAEEAKLLLSQKFDYIFFTGGTSIGRVVMEAAAKNLTPLTLELGGKSPCIVAEDADIAFAAKKIIWGKMNNAGQVCISPDYVFVHTSQKASLIEALKNEITNMYGEQPRDSKDYARIINQKHFSRLQALLSMGDIIVGGQCDENELYIAPTLMENIDLDSKLIQEEIFGPILPILTFENLEEVIHFINARATPLALYLFSKNKREQQRIISQVPFGGGCMNDCLMHVANYHLPFGGLGESGMGQYHGRYSFETFSHRKSIYKKNTWLDSNLQYPPYTSRKQYWLRKLMRR